VLGGVLVVGPLNVLFFRPRRRLIREIEPVEALTWSPKALRVSLSVWLGRGLVCGLVAGLVFGLVGRLVFRLSYGLDIGLVSGLVFGLAVGLVFGLASGVPRKQLTEGSLLFPNEGIRRSLKNGLVFGLAVGLVFGLGGLLVGRLVFGPLIGLVFGLGGLLVVGPIFGMGFGLNATMRHYTLRFWLWRAKCTPAPWRYVAFLDDAVEQLLLRKVGGGYIFRHGLLQDYFASLETLPSEEAPTASASL
jgi:hypothetical protein